LQASYLGYDDFRFGRDAGVPGSKPDRGFRAKKGGRLGSRHKPPHCRVVRVGGLTRHDLKNSRRL
jgi:hypothetical protein